MVYLRRITVQNSRPHHHHYHYHHHHHHHHPHHHQVEAAYAHTRWVVGTAQPRPSGLSPSRTELGESERSNGRSALRTAATAEMPSAEMPSAEMLGRWDVIDAEDMSSRLTKFALNKEKVVLFRRAVASKSSKSV